MPHYAGAHGYIQLTLANKATGQAACQAIKSAGGLQPGETIENVGWMEDPAAPPDANGMRPAGVDVIVEVALAGGNPSHDAPAHQRVQALAQLFEGLKAGTVSHFRAGLTKHWCCYSDY